MKFVCGTGRDSLTLRAVEHLKDPPVIRFGPFEVDLRAGELRKKGVKVKLQQQPFQVLIALLGSPGEVVSRDELRNRLWPDDTFVDFEHGLNAAVKRLRDALGDSAETPIFIETLAKRGYRFVNSVNGHRVPGNEAFETLAGKAYASPWIARSAGICAVVLAGGLVFAIWFLTRPKPNAEHLEVHLTANSAENPVTGAAISPDGKYLVYSDSTGRYLKLIRTGETHPLPLPRQFSGTPAGWFPDGAHLLFAAAQRPGAVRGLWDVSMNGGTPRQLVASALTGAVSPDGLRIASVGGVPLWGDFGNEIWVVNVDGTNPLKLVSSASNTVIGAIAWAPNSRSLAYVRSQSGGYMTGNSSIEIVSLNGAARQTLLADGRLGSGLSWLPDDRLVYTLHEEPPNRRDSNAWAVHLDSSSKAVGVPVRLTQSPGWISSLTATSDGEHLSLLKNDWGGHAFLGRLTPDQNRFLSVRRMTFEESNDVPTSWTADSKAVFVSSDRNGHYEIFKQQIGQTLPETLVSTSDEAFMPRLSPDGSEVLYESHPAGASSETLISLSAAPVTGGVPRKILVRKRLGNVECAREPSTVCIFHTFGGTRKEFFRFDPKTGQTSELTQVETDSIVDWGLSPDGSQLAIIPYHPDGSVVHLRSIATSGTRDLVVKGWSGLVTVDWAADSQSMFIGTMDKSGHNALLHVTLDGTAHALLETSFPTVCGCAFWAIPSPDGKWAAINEPSGASNVWELNTF